MSDLERSTFDLDRYPGRGRARGTLGPAPGVPGWDWRGSPRQRRKSPGGWWWWCATACRLALSLGFGILGNPQNLDYQTVRQEVPEHAGVSLPEDPKICAAETGGADSIFRHRPAGGPGRDAVPAAVVQRGGEQVPSTDPAKEAPSGKRAIGWREALVFVVASIFFTAFLFELLEKLSPVRPPASAVLL